MSEDQLSLNAHTALNVSVLPVSVSRLVFVHKIHVNGAVGNLFIELRQQMTQRFFIFLQTDDPHLRRRKSMHPCNNACTFRIVVRIIQCLADGCLTEKRGFQNQLKRQSAACVHTLHDLRGMLRYFSQTLVSVQVLRTCAEPEFVIFHYYCLLLPFCIDQLPVSFPRKLIYAV